MRFFGCILWSLVSMLAIVEKGNAVEPYSQILHEAFIGKTGGTVLLDAIPEQPPERIQERSPSQADFETIWIPGYWDWDPNHNDFVWVSGVFRRPPPNHEWISGFWMQYEQGWVRIPGFWGLVPENQIQYIQQLPPDPINENIPKSPGNGFFWAEGYWEYSPRDQDFFWVKGEWTPIDPNWIYVPGHYMWHPEGYIYIPPYWDWPIEKRGVAYSAVFIEHSDRPTIIYEPAYIVEGPAIIETLFPYYPDYISVFYHWHFYHPHFWDDFCCVPPWWGWHDWWTFPWHDQWALWWWYTHPGYPQPFWMNAQVSAAIAPPPATLLSMFKNVKGPEIVTPNGVVAPNSIIQSIANISKRPSPILPSNTPQRDQILKSATAKLKPVESILRPAGKAKPSLEARPSLSKPMTESLGPTKQERPMKVPSKPLTRVPDRAPEWKRPPLRTPEVQDQRPLRPQDRPLRIPPTRRPSQMQPQDEFTPQRRPIPPIRRPQTQEEFTPQRRPLPPTRRPQTQEEFTPQRRPLPPTRRPQTQEEFTPQRRPLPPTRRPQTQEEFTPQRRPLPPTRRPQTQEEFTPQIRPPSIQRPPQGEIAPQRRPLPPTRRPDTQREIPPQTPMQRPQIQIPQQRPIPQPQRPIQTPPPQPSPEIQQIERTKPRLQIQNEREAERRKIIEERLEELQKK